MKIQNWSDGEDRGKLDALASRFGTDKAGGGHGYTRWYEQVLAGRAVSSVLEIGVGGGGSLKMWAEFFPTARVVGVDIQPEKAKYAGERIAVIVMDAGKPDALRAAFDGKAFDLIVDDGSHREADVFASLQTLWPMLNAGGIYAIEDLGCHDFTATAWPAKSFLGRLSVFASEAGASLSVFPSQNRYASGNGGQCLAVLFK